MNKLREAARQALETLERGDILCEVTAASILRVALQTTTESQPFGSVTIRRLSQRFENHVDQYQFYPWGPPPYLDNVDECVVVYKKSST